MSVLVKDKTTGEWVQVAGGVSYSYAPIGAIYPYGGTSAPSGYLMCDGSAVSRTDYSALFAVIGESFGSGDGSTTFNVPDLRGKFLEGVPSGGVVGTSVEAGLPNITGSIAPKSVSDVAAGAASDASGAFNKVEIGTSRTYSGSSSQYDVIRFDFDASKSNSIYGNSSTVQPPAVCVNYIIKAKDVNLSVGGQALADRVETLETVNTMTVTKQGNYINGANFHGKKIGKVATIEINGDTGTSIPWAQITTVGVATGCATPLTEL